MANQMGRDEVYPTTHHFQNTPLHSVNTSVYKVSTVYFLGFQAKSQVLGMLLAFLFHVGCKF